MKKLFWKGLGLIDLLVILLITIILLAIVASRYDNFKCRSIKSEARFSLHEIYAAQMRFYEEYNRFATTNKLINIDKRVVLPGNFYWFKDAKEPDEESFLVQAYGKENSLVQGEVWSIDEKKNLQIISSGCKEYNVN